MFEQQLHNYFKRYKAITPRADFLARSRPFVAVLAQDVAHTGWRVKVFETLTMSGALALASFLLLAVIAGISFVARTGSSLMARTGLNDSALTRESSEITFNVHLQEAEYFNESASQVVRALDSIVSEKSTH